MTLLRALTLSALAVLGSQSDLRAQQAPSGVIVAAIEHFLAHCGTAVTDPERYLAELPNRNDGRTMAHGNTPDGSTLLVSTVDMNAMQNGHSFDEATHVFVLGGTRSISCVVNAGEMMAQGAPGSVQQISDTFRSIVSRKAPQAQFVGGEIPINAYGLNPQMMSGMDKSALLYVLNWHEDAQIPIMVYIWPGSIEMITYKQVNAQ